MWNENYLQMGIFFYFLVPKRMEDAKREVECKRRSGIHLNAWHIHKKEEKKTNYRSRKEKWE